MWKSINKIETPKFWDFIRKPNNGTCKIIDETRLKVEVLWGLEEAKEEFKQSDFYEKLGLDWKYALVLRYKREKDEKSRPVVTLSYNEDNFWNIIIQQLQGSNDKNVSFRVSSSFDYTNFYIKLIEDSFSKNWKYVELVDFPKWLENVWWTNKKSSIYYDKLRIWIINLNKKYNITKK